MGLFDSIGSLLFGEEDKQRQWDSLRPASERETSLANQLETLNKDILGSVNIPGAYQSSMDFYNQALSGKLPGMDAAANQISTQINRNLGNTYARMIGNGTGRSTLARQAADDAYNAAASALTNNYLGFMGAMSGLNKDRLGIAQAAYEPTWQMYQDERNFRRSTPYQLSVEKGSPGLVGGLAGAVAEGIGGKIGSGMAKRWGFGNS